MHRFPDELRNVPLETLRRWQADPESAPAAVRELLALREVREALNAAERQRRWRSGEPTA